MGSPSPAVDERPFAVEVVDAETGRGVPLVELKTVHQMRFLTDSAGIAVIDAPELIGIETYFFVSSHGYEYPSDGFGYRGVRLQVEPGAVARVELPRVNIAERLYRVTGGGIYGESIRIGRKPPIEEPLVNGLVFGQDSVFTIPYRGRLWWFWGDTSRPGYPLGNFHMSGATTDLPGGGGIDPNVGINLKYFVDENGFSRPMARMPGDGPTWLSGFAVLPDEDGRERLYAGYAKIKPPLTTYERGICRFDDETEQFERVAVFSDPEGLAPNGHAVPIDDQTGTTFLHFATPYPLVRVEARPEAMTDASRYEAFTCLEERNPPRVERDEQGRPVYRWRAGAAVLGPKEQAELIEAGRMAEGEGLLNLRDIETGDPVFAHAGTVSPNAHRGRWVMITTQLFGRSVLGEVWYAEADSPIGPWAYARRIVTHDQYSFYNPLHHRAFDEDGGRVLFFEGTYTELFSGAGVTTPRYDYNQIMYRLDLDDPRLNLPVAWYRVRDAEGRERFRPIGSLGERPGEGRVAFFALDRPGDGTVPVVEVDGENGITLEVDGEAEETLCFHALPADATDPPPGTVPLVAVRDDQGRIDVRVGDEPLPDGWERLGEPICRVWLRPGPERQPLYP
ncbi:hypothetical protein [Tautonia marina]|uniref:hypothetical protein n=1 Tax=Tautonia marina TaxID=2653855 RepID=UPI0012607183|nr:hypothetical protein [Tautonia marina]